MRASFPDAEAVRRRLRDQGALRVDLEPIRDGQGIVFPCLDGEEVFDFTPRDVRPVDYTGYLTGWSDDERSVAPRAHEVLGDIVVVKVPKELWERRSEVGDALLQFHRVRAVFHDGGVVGEFRTRDLSCIAGSGGSETTVTENGIRLTVDLARAYFSPRLATERARQLATMHPGEHVVDLFAGVGPLAVPAARLGCQVDAIDLNPAAVELARRNAAANSVDMAIHEGDARAMATSLPRADHVVMNLPHGAFDFLDVAARLRPRLIHYHEILMDEDLDGRRAEVEACLSDHGHAPTGTDVRRVRNYAPGQSHWAMEVRCAS